MSLGMYFSVMIQTAIHILCPVQIGKWEHHIEHGDINTATNGKRNSEIDTRQK